MLLTISTTLGVRSGAMQRMPHPCCSQPCDRSSVQDWLDGVVLKHGLCPWAPLSLQNDGLRIVTSHASDEAAVFEDIVDESERLFRADAPSLSTTLLACPDVEGWRDDFEAFDRFVSTAEAALRDGPMGLSLVAFHPSFARWQQLPQEVLASLEEGALSGEGGGAGGVAEGGAAAGAGAEVWAHFEEEYAAGRQVLHRRSAAAERAVVLGADEASVGVRKVAIRFCDGTEQLLPIEWVVATATAEASPPRAPAARPRLADNWLQQCPVPTVHLLRGDELAEEALRAGADAIDALQCRNAQIARSRA